MGETGEVESIWIIGRADEEADELPADRDWGDTVREKIGFRTARAQVPVDRLRAEVEAFVATIGKAIEAVPDTLSGFALDSIQITAEVSAKGSVSLLGTGGEVAGKGGITFTLTRPARA